ncbi:unnamed protein product [Amoebophrya sp. A120]|nr:unnamed protein product [Amoebophrya sp. A120]|eukprot:GSA120T00024407001.1
MSKTIRIRNMADNRDSCQSRSCQRNCANTGFVTTGNSRGILRRETFSTRASHQMAVRKNWRNTFRVRRGQYQ